MSACSSCRRPILWCVTEGGKRMPIDPEPHADGNVVKTGATDLVYGKPVPVVRVLDDATMTLFDTVPAGVEPRFVSHFATCPDADKHRTGR